MQVIIFDNGSGVSVISGFTSDVTDLDAHIAELKSRGDVPLNAAYEIVDDSTLPWDKPRDFWEWV